MKRVLSLILAILMLLGCITLMACKKEEQDNSETLTSSDIVNLEEEKYPDTVGDKKFGGRDFTIFTRSNDANEDYVNEIFPVDTTTVIGKAQYERNVLTEERLDIKLKYVEHEWDLTDTVRTNVLADACEYDLVSNFAAYNPALAAEGLYYDLLDLPYIEFSYPWYNQDFVMEITYNDSLYMISCELALTATEYLCGTMVNIDFLESRGVTDNLYSVVRAGDWTIEYMKTMIADMWVDDGDGVSEPDDGYGLIMGDGQPPLHQLLYGMGFRITERNNNGVPESVFTTHPRNEEAFSVVYDLYHQTPGVGYFAEYKKLVDAIEYYKKGNVGFMFTPMRYIRRYVPDTSFENGFLPMPKYDVEQEKYLTVVGDGYSQMSVPTTVKDTEFVGAVFETLNRYSYFYVRPAVFEIVYGARYMDSEEKSQVFDMIMVSGVYDFGFIYTYSIGEPMTLMSQLIIKPANQYSSEVSGKGSLVKTSLKMLIGKFDKLDKS